MNFLDELNPEQRKAAEQIAGPVIVIAGAGSGKTRVLTYRIAYMIDNDIDPGSILALTFTNKAAKEMKERIAQLVGEGEARQLWMGTFHSIFARILRRESLRIGYPSNFTIYDADDSKSLIKKLIKELDLDDKVYKPSAIQHRISSAKNALISSDLYNDDPILLEEDRAARRPFTGEIYRQYDVRCFRAGAMDFDDLLLKTHLLLQGHPEVLLKYQEKFKFILVDEYQDTNTTQAAILRKLAARHENICVVGDDAQSIYSFRGASIKNILSFQKEYPDANLYKLEQNYRSTGTIVAAANDLISKNREQLKKKVWTQNSGGEKIKVLKALSDNEEGMLIAADIISHRREHQLDARDFAVLYRTNYQSRAIEEALRKKDIPYRIYGGLSFYQRKEVKDCICYFRSVINPRDEEALTRIINLPKRGIGETTVAKISMIAKEAGVSLWDVLSQPKNYNASIASGVALKIRDFCTTIAGLHQLLEKENAFDLALRILNTSGLLREMHSDKTVEGVNRYENVQELLNGIKEFVTHAEAGEDENIDGSAHTLATYMQDIALLTDADKSDPLADVVTLMTIHASKGLEFPYVFVCGLEENLFPSMLSMQSRADLEEERRLFYVAITRAKAKLTLSYSTSRFRWGNLSSCEPSRFLAELPEDCLDFVRPTAKIPPSQVAKPRPLLRNLKPVGDVTTSPTVINASFSLSAGQRISHERFGTGTIVSIEGDDDNRKALIDFEMAGRKQLLLKFARLYPIN